ncbi:MAG: DUF4034 domain-containing protein [Planctomycetes bacterium]|nr:DUF4034 domain-containing protein [Planctomycetota bacterium]
MGSRDPRWDESARHAIDLGARYLAGEPEYVDATEVFEACKRARALGCADPVVEFLHAYCFRETSTERKTWDRLLRTSAAQILGSRYSAGVKCVVLIDVAAMFALPWRIAEGAADPVFLGTLLDGVLGWLPEMCADESVSNDMVILVAAQVVQYYPMAGFPREQGKDRVIPILEAARPGAVAAPSVEGTFWVNFAWDARGSGYANTVTAAGWAGFHERLLRAEEVLNRAWEMDPSSANAPYQMISVAMGLGWSAEKMDVWFQRAMSADGDHYHACGSKMLFLHPKWGGSFDAMLAFGRACLDSGSWQVKIRLMIVDAHIEIRKGRGMTPQEYWSQPQAWKDVQSAFVPFLDRFPNAKTWRTQYAMLACDAGEWAIAREQFNLIGDSYCEAFFNTREKYEKYRRQAENGRR